MRDASAASGGSSGGSDGFVAELAARIGRARFARVSRRHANTDFGRHKPHYLDLDRCLRRAVDWARWLDLDDAQPRRILDIGTGPGFFPFVCQHLGHEVVATEHTREESRMWDFWRRAGLRWRALRHLPESVRYRLLPRRSLYGDVTRLLGVRPVTCTVRHGRPLPARLGRFDLITAQALFFDRPSDQTPWGLENWRWFIGDASRLLGDSGELALGWAREGDDVRAALAALADAGGGVDRRRVRLTRAAMAAFVSGERTQRTRAIAPSAAR